MADERYFGDIFDDVIGILDGMTSNYYQNIQDWKKSIEDAISAFDDSMTKKVNDTGTSLNNDFTKKSEDLKELHASTRNPVKTEIDTLKKQYDDLIVDKTTEMEEHVKKLDTEVNEFVNTTIESIKKSHATRNDALNKKYNKIEDDMNAWCEEKKKQTAESFPKENQSGN